MSGVLESGAQPPAKSTCPSARILIADDSIGVCRYLKTFLLNQGRPWTVCGEAFDGEQAVWLADQLKPDVILLDLAMPVMGGLQAAQEILKARPGAPIILFTLHKSAWVNQEAERVGVRRVVSKFETTEALLAAVKDLLAEGDGHAEASDAAND